MVSVTALRQMVRRALFLDVVHGDLTCFAGATRRNSYPATKQAGFRILDKLAETAEENQAIRESRVTPLNRTGTNY